MNSLYAAIKFASSNDYYVSDISFGVEPEEFPASEPLCNASFLPESRVAAGFAALTGLSEAAVSDLLSGVKSIHDFPEMDYCIPIKQSQRRVIDGIYCYELPNGIHVVGLDEQHEVIQRLKKGETIRALEFSTDVTSAICSTKGSKKRANVQNGASGVICTIHMPDGTVTIELPEVMRDFFVVETNIRLVDEPSIIALPEEGWLVLLMDKRRTTRHHKVRKT